MQTDKIVTVSEMNILFGYRPQTNQYESLNQMIIIAKY
jgi:hypothetical protein